MTRDVLPALAAAVAIAVGASVLFSISDRPAPTPEGTARGDVATPGDRGPASLSGADPRADPGPRQAPDRSDGAVRSPGPAPGPIGAGASELPADLEGRPAARPLVSRRMVIPVEGVLADALAPGFDLARGSRQHEALDIMAPRGTPVLAVDDGYVEKLFTSDAGGLTIYQFDDEREHAYYYAHLEQYAPGLAEGDRITRQQVIGYVGTTGNAPKDAPHLHFAIMRLGAEKRWWQGTAIDPYPLLRRGETATAREQRPQVGSDRR